VRPRAKIPGLEEFDSAGGEREELDCGQATPDIVPVPEEVGANGLARALGMDDGDERQGAGKGQVLSLLGDEAESLEPVLQLLGQELVGTGRVPGRACEVDEGEWLAPVADGLGPSSVLPCRGYIAAVHLFPVDGR
jgi:hypothetical protein